MTYPVCILQHTLRMDNCFLFENVVGRAMLICTSSEMQCEKYIHIAVHMYPDIGMSF